MPFPWVSIVPAYFEFLDLPNLHDYMSQSLKINGGEVREGVEERSVTSFTFTECDIYIHLGQPRQAFLCSLLTGISFSNSPSSN